MEYSEGYLSPSESSNKEPNRASLMDIQLQRTMINLKNSKKWKDQEKEVRYG
ncbi:13002_t:CDS:1, partial [Dentiscutata erythropus]